VERFFNGLLARVLDDREVADTVSSRVAVD
jgi:hypothetical protein